MYYKKADYQASIRYTLEALKLLHDLQIMMYLNPKQKFLCYWNLKIYYDSLNLISKKNEALDSCISIGLTSNITNILILHAIRSKISYLQDIGEYSRCLQYVTLGQNVAEKYGFTNDAIMGQIFTLKINALLLMDNYPVVATELKNKLAHYKHFKIDVNIGNLYELWASYYLGIGQIDSALFSYKKSYQIYLQAKFTPGCASSLNGLGFIYSDSLREYSTALGYYNQALSYYDARQSLSTLTNMGNVYVKKHLFDSAFYFYQKAFDQIYPGLNESGLLNNRNFKLLNSLADYVVTLVLDKADAHLSQYKSTHSEDQLRQTLASYKKADQVMDIIKQNQFEIQSKLSWRKNARRLYEHAIEASWLEKNSEFGLYFFEKSRAVLLDDQMKTEQLMQDREIVQQFQLKRKLNRLENELDTTNTQSDRYSRLQTEIINAKEEQDRFLQGINEKDPLYIARNSRTEAISVVDLQKGVLKDHRALVEIFDGDSSLYILLITKSGSSISKINKQAYDSLSRKFMEFISNPIVRNNEYETFIRVSRNLYQLIFPDSALPTGRIIISPDGIVFPFEALITNGDRDIHYMLNDYSISYTYSARFLMSRFSNSSERQAADFMGMAPVDYASYLNLVSLKGSDVSLRQIQSHFSKPFTATASAATKNYFLSNFTDYRIVQLYSHASYSDSSGKPVIYFADSSLDLSELYSKERPVARLVVLSACETALGKDYRGEGVFSFSREFAALGIPASVSNLWSVDNEATYRITELFYQFVTRGLPTDLALQQAKLKYIKNASRARALPFYWASPILTGKSEIIKIKTSIPVLYDLLLIIIAGMIFWLWSFYRKRRKTV